MTDQLSPEKPKKPLQLSNLPDRMRIAPEVANVLHCSAVQVYRMAKRGEIASMPFGKSVQFLPTQVTDFVNGQLRDTNENNGYIEPQLCDTKNNKNVARGVSWERHCRAVSMELRINHFTAGRKGKDP